MPDLLTDLTRSRARSGTRAGSPRLVLRDLEERVHVAVPRASSRAELGRYAPLRLVVAGVSRTVRARYRMVSESE